MSANWNNLLIAVDIKLKAQKRAKLSRDQSTSSSVSPEFGPNKPTHSRSRDGVSRGGAPYSGSTADVASLLNTSPQRKLDHDSMQGEPKCHASSMPSIPLVSSPQRGRGGQSLRVQASGRRGPRGQSRFKGLCITRAGKWRAIIYLGQKQKYLGVFGSEYQAARAYDAAALQYFGDGAKLNFPYRAEQQMHENTHFSLSGASEGGIGAGGPAVARSYTPPALEPGVNANEGSGRKRNHKSTFIDYGDDWKKIRDDGSWKYR